MSTTDRRKEIRTNPTLRFSPVFCVLNSAGQQIPLQIVNYHYRGACFKVEKDDYRPQQQESYLNFKIGSKDLPEKIFYRIIWESISENGMFGVEFSTESKYVLARAERFLTHNVNQPIISSQDPLDPNRILYFKAINVSSSGMLLSTSLSNKHLFPGMELRCAVLEIPGIGKTEIDLFIENARSTDDGKTIQFGTSVKGSSHTYHDLISKYLSNLGSTTNADERIEKLAANGLMSKKLSRHLTIREVDSEQDYDKVLKLRFDGYKRAGKTKDGITYLEMGEGLKNEGLILGAYLGGQLVASVELRFSHMHKLRLSAQFDFGTTDDLAKKDFCEINKLVVHPRAQSTDIVLGLFQKIHAIVMLNGKQEGLLVAEDKLVPLYLKLGAKKTKLGYPHPLLAGVTLHVMTIPRKVYENANDINPYAWSQVYENTHNYLESVGLSQQRVFFFHERIIFNLSKFLVRIKGKHRRGKIKNEDLSPKSQKIDTKLRTDPIDPRWTKQHVHASVLLPYLLVSDEMIGAQQTHKILLSYGFSREYFSSSSNWISMDFFNGFIAEFKKHGNVEELQRRSGYKNLSKEVLGVNHFLLKHFLSPQAAFKALPTYLSKFNKTRWGKVIDSGPTFCRLQIGITDANEMPADPSTILNWKAIIDGHVSVITGKHGEVQVVKSIFDGAPYDEFLITWQNPFINWKSIVGHLLALAALIKLATYTSQNYSTTQIAYGLTTLFFASASIYFLFSFIKSRKKYNGIVDSLTQFQKDADERYKELQNSKSVLEKSYQEGKLLETMNREVQRSEDVAQIFEVALESLCTKFNFKRAFIMLIDNDAKYLRTVAVNGEDSERTSGIWQFKVDVTTQRENPMVLSSVYRTSQSIVISNIDDHKFQLNETSRRLVESLRTKGFAMVPIPSDSRNWGVMIADKGEENEIITRRDLVAMQRIAQSIGMALDKKAKLDEEVRARNIFQKFVPSAVVENTLGKKDLSLGGEVREAICLFLDIRDFTKMSNTLPPQTTVDILNRVFGLLQKTVQPSGGVIDKFLGDGALVTWGAVPGPTPSPTTAIQAAIEFTHQLDAMVKEFRVSGVPNLRVGIGMHKGPVIAGNIGSNERMEFTVIGNTVNMASRLEQLSKVLGTTIVISSDLMPFAPQLDLWKTHEGIQVRGIEQPISVSSYHPTSSSSEKKSEESA